MSSSPFFLMIKPDGIARGLVGKIISRFEKKGFALLEMRLIRPKNDEIDDMGENFLHALMERHYQSHSEKTFYDELMEFSLSGPVIAMIWMGNIQVARSLVGCTIPWDAKPGTIRGDFASSLPANLVHCSSDAESALREVNLWKESFYKDFSKSA